METNLPRILERLRAAAGDDVPVLVLGYYNPWVAAKALDQPVQGVDAAAKAYTRLSSVIEDSAADAGATFVGLDDAFATDDTTPTTINGRTVPENAARICTLTNICTAGDIHLTDEGAATVARVLADAAIEGRGVRRVVNDGGWADRRRGSGGPPRHRVTTIDTADSAHEDRVALLLVHRAAARDLQAHRPGPAHRAGRRLRERGPR